MLLHTYRLNPSHPDQVHRSRPKARFRVEIPASMPARKFLSFLYTQLLLAISRRDMPRLFAKTASLTPLPFAKARLSFEAKPPSAVTCRGILPYHCLCCSRRGLYWSLSAGLPLTMRHPRIMVEAPPVRKTLCPYSVSLLPLT